MQQTDVSVITIRKAVKKDINFLVEQRIIYLHKIEKVSSKLNDEKLKAETLKFFNKNIAANRLITMVAEAENKIVGWGCLLLRDEPPYFDLPDGNLGYIFNMYTMPDYRRNGIGTQLLQNLVDEAKKSGLSRIELNSTSAGNSLYRKFGFKDSAYPLMDYKIL